MKRTKAEMKFPKAQNKKGETKSEQYNELGKNKNVKRKRSNKQ